MKEYNDTRIHVLSEETSLLAEFRQRARERADEVFSDPASTAVDRKKAEDILTFTTVEDCYKRAPKSTVFAIIRYLGYEFPGESFISALYNQMYEKLIEEIDRRYILINPDKFLRNTR